MSAAKILRALMPVQPLGNDFVHNVYDRGRWKDFNTCLVTGSTHPINETNFSFVMCFLIFYIVISIYSKVTHCKSHKGVKICATWSVSPQKRNEVPGNVLQIK